jgi:hypothetical protein
LLQNANDISTYGFHGSHELAPHLLDEGDGRRMYDAVHRQFGNDGCYLWPCVQAGGSLQQLKHEFTRWGSILVHQEQPCTLFRLGACQGKVVSRGQAPVGRIVDIMNGEVSRH